MKLALFAAAALFATPALAQTTGGAGSGTPVGPDAKAAAATGQSSIDSASTSSPSSMSSSSPSSMSSSTSSGSDPVGGYQPSQPMPTASDGVQPVFTPGPSVAQAYPAPAPLQNYPICKKGQYDKCMQRGGR